MPWLLVPSWPTQYRMQYRTVGRYAVRTVGRYTVPYIAKYSQISLDIDKIVTQYQQIWSTNVKQWFKYTLTTKHVEKTELRPTATRKHGLGLPKPIKLYWYCLLLTSIPCWYYQYQLYWLPIDWRQCSTRVFAEKVIISKNNRNLLLYIAIRSAKSVEIQPAITILTKFW